jgi:glycosyltransferase involved in cell wall biosynthesis
LLSVDSPFSQFSLAECPDRKLTLCLTTPTLQPKASDPVGRQVWYIARALAACGHEIHLFGSTKHCPPSTENWGVGISSGRTSFMQGVWLHHAADGIELHRAIKELGATRHLDLVIANGSDASYCLGDPSLNCVVCLNGEIAASQSPCALHSQVIAPGRAQLGRIRKILGGPFSPVGVNICSPVVPDRHKDFFSSRADATRILFVGSLNLDHGVDLFLQAATTLICEHRDIEAIITGDANEPSETGRSFRTCLESAVFDPELSRRIHFVGDLSEDGLCQTLADCQIICLPYQIDVAAVPCLEAMTFGRAVVASDLDSAVEILGEKNCGLLHRCGDATAITDRLRELVTDVGLRKRLGQQARLAYESHFVFDRSLTATLNTYKRLIDRAAE